MRPEYLAEKNANLTVLEASDLMNRSVLHLQNDAIADYTNGRLEILRKDRGANINHGQIAAEAAAAAAQNARTMLKGKKLRRTMRRIFQQERGVNLRTEGTSAHLADGRLAALRAQRP